MTEGLFEISWTVAHFSMGRQTETNLQAEGNAFYSHRKEDVHRERCPGKPTSSWAVGLSVMRASDGVRK